VIRLRWLARHAVQRLGRQGVAGFGLLIAAAAFGAGVILPLDARVAELKAQMSSPARERSDASPPPRPSDPAADLDVFYRSFPSDDELTDLLAKLHGIGDRHGLALQQADYRAADERGQRLGQYRISVPAIATYPQLKHFLAAVLAEMPNLSLDQLSLQRHAVADPRVDVQMQFTLYLRQRM
jgi:Type II secretion system (T2SS), protein M subtype b